MLTSQETNTLAQLVLKRFGGHQNLTSACHAWQRLLQNNCSLYQFEELIKPLPIHVAYSEFLESVDKQLLSIKSELDNDNDADVESDLFDQFEPECGTVEVRRFLDQKYLHQADKDVFNENLLKEETFDLLQASKMAALDAYRAFLQDRFNEVFHGQDH